MDNKSIISKFEKSFEKLKKDDYFLLENDLSERCVMNRLVIYLQEEFKGYKVDSEYNKIGTTNSKKVKALRGELEELKNKIIEAEYKNINVFPDIIVHNRGNQDHNLLAIEIAKKTHGCKKKEFDKLKLKKYTESNDDSKLEYNIGIYLCIKTTGDFTEEIKCYNNDE